MKILFINPPLSKVVDTSLPEVLLEKGDPMPPLGLMYLASYLKKNTDYEAQILDCQVEDMDFEQMKKKIAEINPDIIGITVMTFTLLDVIAAAKIAKKINPDIKVITGGPHVNIYPQETMAIPEVDYVVLGEGEMPLKDLLDNIGQPEKLREIKGLVFRDGGNVVNTGQRDLIKDLDSIPFPDRTLLPYKKYSSVMSAESPVTTMFTSRGCPFRCLFCDRPHLGKVFRARSANNVVDEMEECQKLGIKEIFIYDDTFTVDRQRVFDICAEIKKRKLSIVWDVRARVDTVNEEVLLAMKDAGCQRIHFGVEAGSDRVLKVLRKGITIDQVKTAFGLAHKIGITTLAYFMMGSPTETKKDILQTIKLAKKLNPDYVHLAITTPFPGTDLYTQGLEQGILPYDYWKRFAENPTREFTPLYWEENLKKEELMKLLKKAYRGFYFRPAYIIKKILSVSSFEEFRKKAGAAFQLLRI